MNKLFHSNPPAVNSRVAQLIHFLRSIRRENSISIRFFTPSDVPTHTYTHTYTTHVHIHICMYTLQRVGRQRRKACVYLDEPCATAEGARACQRRVTTSRARAKKARIERERAREKKRERTELIPSRGGRTCPHLCSPFCIFASLLQTET